MIKAAEEAIPRSAENIALAIGALCVVRVLCCVIFYVNFII